MKTRPVQEIFNAIIDGGFYAEDQQCMRRASYLAASKRVITVEEKCIADIEHDKYILRLTGIHPALVKSLNEAINHQLLGHDFNSCLSIFKSWEKRPLPRG